eukprot:scaffold631_cov318-Pavlova_lutheri.AAC.3
MSTKEFASLSFRRPTVRVGTPEGPSFPSFRSPNRPERTPFLNRRSNGDEPVDPIPGPRGTRPHACPPASERRTKPGSSGSVRVTFPFEPGGALGFDPRTIR